MNKNGDLTQGNITSQLLKMAIPLVATSFIQTTYSLVDMIWIGKLGSKAVAAVGSASFLINMSIALFTLIVTGTGIKISHRYGAKEYDKISTYISNGFFMAIVMGLLYGLLIFVFKNEVIGFFNMNDLWIEANAKKYMIISMIGTPIMYINMVYSSMFNSMGNSKITFILNSAGLLTNMLLDPLLIFGVNGYLKLGVEGAAYASVIGRMVVLILYVIKRKEISDIKMISKKIHIGSLKEVVRLGLPNTIQRVSFIAIAMVMARLIAQFGPIGIAVQKIGIQVESISFMTIGGLHGAVSVFIGQNFGVGNMHRIRKGYQKSLLISLAFGLMTSFIFITFAEPIFRFFIKDVEAIGMGIRYLQIIGLSQMFMCIEIVSMASFNGVGKTHIPAIVSLTFTLLRLPAAYWLSTSMKMGLDGVWWSISGSSMIKGVLLVLLFIIFLSREKNLVKSEVKNVEIKRNAN